MRTRPSPSCSSRPSSSPRSARSSRRVGRGRPARPEFGWRILPLWKARPWARCNSRPIALASSVAAAEFAGRFRWLAVHRSRIPPARCSIPSSAFAAAFESSRKRRRASRSGPWSHRRAAKRSISSTSTTRPWRSSAPACCPGPRRKCSSIIWGSRPAKRMSFNVSPIAYCTRTRRCDRLPTRSSGAGEQRRCSGRTVYPATCRSSWSASTKSRISISSGNCCSRTNIGG